MILNYATITFKFLSTRLFLINKSASIKSKNFTLIKKITKNTLIIAWNKSHITSEHSLTREYKESEFDRHSESKQNQILRHVNIKNV